MVKFFTYYAESNIVCLLIFGILLFHDLLNKERQEKQIKYDHALAAFIAFFIVDIIWAAVIDGVIPKTKLSVSIVLFANFIFMSGITYFWLQYVMAVEQTPHRNRKINKFAILFPFLIVSLVMIICYIFDSEILIDDNLESQNLFNVFLIIVPLINISAIVFYAMRKAIKEEDPIEKVKHYYVGIFPIIVVAGGLFQIMLFPELPIFCFCCTFMMLIYYIKSLETQISTDPLTKLNNRTQLSRYISQPSNVFLPNRLTYFVMIDVNDFKLINDTYGHAAGDKALVFIAETLKKVAALHDMPVFISRYGGDEFVLIVHPIKREEIDILIADFRKYIFAGFENNETPYRLSIGVGYDELVRGKGSVQKCLQSADINMYADKEIVKQEFRS